MDILGLEPFEHACLVRGRIEAHDGDVRIGSDADLPRRDSKFCALFVPQQDLDHVVSLRQQVKRLSISAEEAHPIVEYEPMFHIRCRHKHSLELLVREPGLDGRIPQALHGRRDALDHQRREAICHKIPASGVHLFRIGRKERMISVDIAIVLGVGPNFSQNIALLILQEKCKAGPERDPALGRPAAIFSRSTFSSSFSRSTFYGSFSRSTFYGSFSRLTFSGLLTASCLIQNSSLYRDVAAIFYDGIFLRGVCNLESDLHFPVSFSVSGHSCSCVTESQNPGRQLSGLCSLFTGQKAASRRTGYSPTPQGRKPRPQSDSLGRGS